jgi:anthranilate synthase/aminodeoxychorismate synthase-like glutamine amidotransferase
VAVGYKFDVRINHESAQKIAKKGACLVLFSGFSCLHLMLLVIDNYDSFTYNLVQYLGELGAEMRVIRNDDLTVDEIEDLGPERILISPGPGPPDTAGVSLGVIERFEDKVPILGVCLGHQAIGQHFGGKVVRAPEPVHGKPVEIVHDGRTLFDDIPNNFAAGRYHSLIVDRDEWPDVLEISAESPDGIVMGLRHKTKPIEGVQFHPESILTEHGKKLLQNFLEL